MSLTLELLDQALAMGEAELTLLAEGEVEQAEASALERAELLDRAMAQTEGMSTDLLRSKLLRLRELQGELTDEAKRLHGRLLEDLARTQQESRRYAGYHGAVSAGQSGLNFVSKRG